MAGCVTGWEAVHLLGRYLALTPGFGVWGPKLCGGSCIVGLTQGVGVYMYPNNEPVRGMYSEHKGDL